MPPAPELLLGVANLHDVFMNANLMRTLMEREPVETDPLRFHISNRIRLERAWAAYLYVLIEAWEAKSNARVRQYIETKISLDTLNATLKNARKAGVMKSISETRHYMCHRDKREYWDTGRTGPIGNLKTLMELNNEIGAVLFVAMQP